MCTSVGRPGQETDEHGRPVERIARVEGHGPVTWSWIREVLGPHARFTVRPVLDLAGQAPVDAYEIPQRHRRAVRLMTPADIFPGSPPAPHQGCRRPPPPSPTTTWAERGRQLRADDHHPPPDQDPRPVAGPATLPRHLRLARPARRVLPRRLHRHPPGPQARPDPAPTVVDPLSRGDLPGSSGRRRRTRDEPRDQRQELVTTGCCRPHQAIRRRRALTPARLEPSRVTPHGRSSSHRGQTLSRPTHCDSSRPDRGAPAGGDGANGLSATASGSEKASPIQVGTR